MKVVLIVYCKNIAFKYELIGSESL
jgi:hypothetical protein